MSAQIIIFGYWPIRGIAQPIRDLLVLVGQDFQEQNYVYGPGTDYPEHWEDIKVNWKAVKNTLGLDFPNLPYLIDGEVRLSQNSAIMHYLARKHGLMPEDTATMARCEMLEQQLKDYVQDFAVSVAYAPNLSEEQDKFTKVTIHEYLGRLTDFLGDKEWFASKFSYVDVIAHYALELFRLFTPSSFDKYPKLTAFASRFENLPRFKEYFNTQEYQRRPIFSPLAKWNNK